MSLIENGQRLRCDGENCECVALAPIALRPTLSEQPSDRPAAGWLFLVGQEAPLHFCPACAQRQLYHARAEKSESR